MDKIEHTDSEARPLLDLGRLWAIIRRHRRSYWAVPVVAVVTYLCMLTVPRTYSCMVLMAPEIEDMSKTGLVSVLATAGVNLGKFSTTDALNVYLYPVMVDSYDFITRLFPVEVETADGKVRTSYYNYLDRHARQSLLEAALSTVTGWIAKDESTYNGTDSVDNFALDKHQFGIAKRMHEMIECGRNLKTDVITIRVRDRDPKVCAMVAEYARRQLLSDVYDYRTKKCRQTIAYNRRMLAETRAEYDRTRRAYAAFCDANTDVKTKAVTSRMLELENEMQLAFNQYSATVQLLQASEAKLKERTPLLTVMHSASVPHKPDGPSRMGWALAMAVAACVVITVYHSREYVC